MAEFTSPESKSQTLRTKPLRAIIEITGGDFKIFPVGDSDADEQRIWDALRFIREDFAQ